MDPTTLIVAMSIPSGITAFAFWLIERRLAKHEAAQDEKDKARKQNEVLIIKGVNAAIALGEALDYAGKIKHDQKDFLTEQGIDALY